MVFHFLNSSSYFQLFKKEYRLFFFFSYEDEKGRIIDEGEADAMKWGGKN